MGAEAAEAAAVMHIERAAREDAEAAALLVTLLAFSCELLAAARCAVAHLPAGASAGN